MYHIDRHPTQELRKKKVSKAIIPVEFLYDVRPAYTGIGFELYWTDEQCKSNECWWDGTGINDYVFYKWMKLPKE